MRASETKRSNPLFIRLILKSNFILIRLLRAKALVMTKNTVIANIFNNSVKDLDVSNIVKPEDYKDKLPNKIGGLNPQSYNYTRVYRVN